ncbi:MAG: hypothetical protein JNN08_05560 [Bryobacterales bacterium]|nr:hypothetical protein [Bryobacterales bacterium]
MLAAATATVALFLLSPASLTAAITTYSSTTAFDAAAGPVRGFNFATYPPTMGPSTPVNPAFPTGLQYMGYDGVCFQNVYNHYGLFLYTFPANIIRADLPANTYAVGAHVGVFYGWSPLDSEFTITVATSSGIETFTRRRDESSFVGVSSPTPIRWISVSHPLEYHLFFDFRLTASAGSAPGCPLPLDAAGPAVENVALSPNPAVVNAPVTVSADLTDVATGGSNIAAAEYSVGGGYQAMAGGFNVTPTTTATAAISGIAQAGVYDVCVRGTDAAGNTGTPSCTPLVVYDPNAGFVTGGGWIHSPPGAYAADASLQGKATFGFVSEYAPGAHVPTGNTRFQFHAAKMSFRSTAYDWMVVAGARVQYKGTGALNGEAGYWFLLTAIDGERPGGGGTDRFRLKIWSNAGVVYDNQLNAPDSDDPTTVLGGGSITIHK